MLKKAVFLRSLSKCKFGFHKINPPHEAVRVKIEIILQVAVMRYEVHYVQGSSEYQE